MRLRVVVVLFALALASCSGERSPLATQVTMPSAGGATTDGPASSPEKPNIVFVLADDLSYRLLYRHMDSYPNVRALASRGVTFNRFYATESVCCPSRATSMTGQYAHNHGLMNNDFGSASAFRPLEDETLPVWLKGAGYATAYYGRYLNGYESGHRPPGWDVWDGRPFSMLGEGPESIAVIPGYGPDGRNREGKTHTGMWAEKVSGFVRSREEPFFVYFAPYAPHEPGAYPASYRRLFAKTRAPRTPAFNERDTSDKPRWVKGRRPFTKRQVARIDRTYREMARATKDLDAALGQIVGALRESGELENTYVVFNSDNGYHYGTHRLDRKWTPYADASRVPLVVSGPGGAVDAGAKRHALVANTDLAPTFAEWADVEPMLVPDGRSFDPLLSENAPSDDSIERRENLLLEGLAMRYYPRPAYSALVTDDGLLYVEYGTGERELYDLARDPLALENRVRGASSALRGDLARKLAALESCAGEACREAELGD